MKKIVLIGAGGHCKVVIDIIKSTYNYEYEIVGITDNKKQGDAIFNVPILGTDIILEKLHDEGVDDAFVCIGALENIILRSIKYKELINIGYKIPVLIHKNSVVSEFSFVGSGTCVMASSVINPGASIGKNCIINTGCIIEHDCVIGNNTHISPNSSISGGVTVGYNTHIGIGSSVIQNVTIGNNVTIGAGAVVINNIPDNSVAVGVPAKIIKMKKHLYKEGEKYDNKI